MVIGLNQRRIQSAQQIYILLHRFNSSTVYIDGINIKLQLFGFTFVFHRNFVDFDLFYGNKKTKTNCRSFNFSHRRGSNLFVVFYLDVY